MLDPATRPPGRPLRALALVVIMGGPALAAEPTSVAVEGGRAEFDVVTPGAGSKTLVVVSALAHEAGPFAVTLVATSKAASEPRPLPVAADPAGPALARPARPIVAAPSVSSIPPWPSRRFSLLVRDGDVASASNYLGVEARLAAVGTRVQVYVDAKDEESLAPGFVEEVVATFDERVYPLAARRFGAAADVDGDGRFTIFVSSWLTRLAGGRYKVDGFVRGADFDRSVDTPFGNRSDMMYLSASLRPGPHLKTVLAHEYTHAVVFSRRALPDGLNGRPRPEEEGWLDEGLAHLVEDAHGFSRTNLDYRVSAFLSRPERYRLVVEDYYAADLFRSHGNRGGAYLFLRWCVDRHGEGVLDRLIRSDLRGVANLEAATGRSFASLYREWTTALFLSGLDPSAHPTPSGQYRSLDPRGTIEDWVLAGPRSTRVKPDGATDAWSAAGTSTHYVVIDGSEKGTVQVKVDGPPAARLQVTVVPLPDDLGGLDLDVRATPGVDGAVAIRARVASQGLTPVRLGAIAWEPLVPQADAREQLFRRSGLDMLGIARRFGTSALAVGGKLASGPIRLDNVRPGDGPLVFKAVGTDAAGRRVAAWAEVEIRADRVEFGVDDGP
jgi:hypothetical protein